MDAARVAALVQRVIGACEDLVRALAEPGAPAATVQPVSSIGRAAVLGWQTEHRIEFLRAWYPTYAPSSLVFRGVRAMEGSDPGSDANIVTYATQRLGCHRPADIRKNAEFIMRDAKALSAAMGWDTPFKIGKPGPTAAPAAPSAPAREPPVGAAIWHTWKDIKELARRDGYLVDEREQLPGYNRRREARGLPPLYIKSIQPKGGFSGD